MGFMGAFRVRRKLHWDGWLYAPPANKLRQSADLDEIWESLKRDDSLTDVERATRMEMNGCEDERSCDPEKYAGDIIIIHEMHKDRAVQMLARRFFVPDAAIPPVEELLAKEKYKKLVGVLAAV